MGMLALGAITIISCSKDEGWDDHYKYLNVEFMTPKTRSTNGIEIVSSGPSLYDIPLYENECMLYAIISIARKNNIPIKQIDGSEPKTIDKGNYSATSAYNLLKKWQQAEIGLLVMLKGIRWKEKLRINTLEVKWLHLSHPK